MTNVSGYEDMRQNHRERISRNDRNASRLGVCCFRRGIQHAIVNSLAPGKFEWNFRHVIFKQILVFDDRGICCEIALIWMSMDFTDDQSTLVQVMAWCRQATSHYLSQCWPRYLSSSGATMLQWVNPSDNEFGMTVTTIQTRWVGFYRSTAFCQQRYICVNRVASVYFQPILTRCALGDVTVV